jgi:putative Ig domain-containing protein/dockerin type I repeat protein
MPRSTVLGAALLAAMVLLVTVCPSVRAADFPLALENRKAGISLSLSGTNGTDWAVERTSHDASIGDQMVFLKSTVAMSLAHNERNALTLSCALPHVLGVNGPDGTPNSGDEGDLYWKVDRDMQSHRYSTLAGALPTYCVKYAAPISFATLTYDGAMAVLGAVGDNGAPWGTQPYNTSDRFAYGQRDRFGNQWHTLTYWDDDEPLLAAAGISSGRQGASDGHCVFMCVNPVTPVIQLHAPAGEQFYTTPVKTYHVPKMWDQTTYLTGGVTIHFVNLTNGDAVQYRVGDGAWQTYAGTALVASALFTVVDTPTVLEVRAGAAGVVYQRTVVLNPSVPAAAEQHGDLMWANEAERQACIDKLHNMQPFKKSYELFRGSYYQGAGTTYDDTRGIWRSGASLASVSLANAMVVAIEGAEGGLTEARMAKRRLLRVARLQPVGFDYNVSFATPAKDYMNELGQTIQQFGDAGMAYDLLAGHFRSTDHAEGMTPIEEICIREGLGKIAKTILQVRANWSATSGAGDTHWSHGYELAVGIIASAMPTYKTPWYGVSGGDRVTVNDTPDGDGKYWNPYPDQGVTWYQCATDADIDTPGHPNVRYPFRAEFQYTDDGWWTGPNDLVGDGSRYFTGPTGSRLVDIKYGGMANAECRVELVEMSGYESPFVGRLHVFDNIRRLKGDMQRAACVTNYIRRRLVMGYVPLSWDADTKIYTAQEARIETSIGAFNNHYEAASLPNAIALVGEYLTHLNIYYGYTPGTLTDEQRTRLESTRKNLYAAYTLALCLDPTQIVPHVAEPNHTPILKPLFKHVVHPGETIRKDIICVDPDNDTLTVTVTGLPGGAVFDPGTRRITWVPTAGDAGVHMATVTVSDGTASVSRPFAMIVKADAPSGPIPAGPTNVTATLAPDQSSVTLAWQAPGGVTVAGYIIYRDGAMWAVTPAGTTSWVDTGILPGTNTRYHVALYSSIGAEASAVAADPSMIRTSGGSSIIGWQSIATHAGAGAIACSISDGGVEPRTGGIAALRITADSALDPATVVPGCVTLVGLVTGDVSSRIDSVTLEPGNQSILVTLSQGLAEVDRFTLSLASSVTDAGGQPLVGGTSITVGVLPGDVDRSGQVTASDVVAARNAAGQGLGAATAPFDVNRSGDITGDDLQAVQKRVGTALP